VKYRFNTDARGCRRAQALQATASRSPAAIRKGSRKNPARCGPRGGETVGARTPRGLDVARPRLSRLPWFARRRFSQMMTSSLQGLGRGARGVSLLVSDLRFQTAPPLRFPGFRFAQSGLRQTQLRIPAALVAPGLLLIVVPRKTEGAGAPQERAQGRPGARCTRGLMCQNAHLQKVHTSIQVQRRASGLPCAMVLTLISCSPR
jgi:hypothetical protein